VEEKMQAKFLFPPAVMTRINLNLLASFNFYQRGHITQLQQKVNIISTDVKFPLPGAYHGVLLV